MIKVCRSKDIIASVENADKTQLRAFAAHALDKLSDIDVAYGASFLIGSGAAGKIGAYLATECVERKIGVNAFVEDTADEKIGQSLCDRTRGRHNVDHVLHTVATRMADPLSAGHELPFRIVPERVAHTTVTACQSRTVRDRAGDVLHVLARNRPHRPARYDQVVFHELFRVREAILCIIDLRRISGFLHHPREPRRGQLGFMSVPAALKNQYLFHVFFSFTQ